MVYCFTHGQAVAPRSASSSDQAVGQLEAKMERKYMTIWWSNTKLEQLCIPYLNNNDDLKIWCFVLVVPSGWRKKNDSSAHGHILHWRFLHLAQPPGRSFRQQNFLWRECGTFRIFRDCNFHTAFDLHFFHNCCWSQSFFNYHLLPSVMLISQCSFGNPIQASSSPLRSLRWPT